MGYDPDSKGQPKKKAPKKKAPKKKAPMESFGGGVRKFR